MTEQTFDQENGYDPNLELNLTIPVYKFASEFLKLKTRREYPQNRNFILSKLELLYGKPYES